MAIRLLFVGESWLGSCARSLKEALARRADIELDEISEDAWFPRPRALWLRALNRLTADAYRRELGQRVLERVRALRPDVVMTYKGYSLHADLILAIQKLGVRTVNVYPDYSPHAYGLAHRAAVGTYDLVISTKPFHPSNWRATYAYNNLCAFVPQGYDPILHLVPEPPSSFEFDVVMVATYRAEYGRLMRSLARDLGGRNIRVAVGGYGWEANRKGLPSHWNFPGPTQGRAYVELLRRGRICVAPLNREVVIDGKSQPGDVDTTRTYELAAAHCFFLHRYTEYARSLYAKDEVSMYDDGRELSALIRYYLDHDNERVAMATRAHLRAVPAYSLDARAEEIVAVLCQAI
ncbi:hypothetical protein BAC2_01687 [uncultured bacterium]|nr:hypothetical protein BAC2_01687 [uncultured bacterium]